MPHTVDASCQEDVRRAGLFSQGSLPRLLALMRAAPETHLGPAEVVRMAAETGLAVSPVELAGQLEALVDHGLLGRVLTTAGGKAPGAAAADRPLDHWCRRALMPAGVDAGGRKNAEV